MTFMRKDTITVLTLEQIKKISTPRLLNIYRKTRKLNLSVSYEGYIKEKFPDGLENYLQQMKQELDQRENV